jgi:phosphoenolpyruvate carboxykinase (ATP)
MYYYLTGYTAKVAGTERGLKEPEATYSACFGAVFLDWHPSVYAEMLGKLLDSHSSQVWLVNTGWSGGPYGVGKRMKLAYTRAMVSAALNGSLTSAPVNTDSLFNLAVPQKVAGVPDSVLNPRATWPNSSDYDAQAARLAQMFAKNFERFAGKVHESVRGAGPRT